MANSVTTICGFKTCCCYCVIRFTIRFVRRLWPDVGRDEFLKVAEVYSQFAKHTTLYTSNGDLPLYLSAVIHDGPRAGYFKPYTIAPGVDTIAVPDFDIDMLGHSYFAQAEALLYDIRSLLLHNEPPRNRLRISPANEDGMEFWKLGR